MCIPSNSISNVWCECDFCGKKFLKKRNEVRNNTYCSNECKNKGIRNPNPPKEQVKVYCKICNTPIYVNESKYKKQDHFLCSRKCYAEHRSLTYKGEAIYNYQNFHDNCAYCNETIKTTTFELENRNNLFCSQECYWLYRKENYKELYFSERRNQGRVETKPEKLMRESLDNLNIKYTQEYPIDNIYFADFYLEKYNIVIEVYGDYWHVNPSIYGEGKREMNDMQKEKIKKDKMKEGYLKKKGYRLIVFWEKEIYEDLDTYLNERLIKRINTQESATTTRQAPK